MVKGYKLLYVLLLTISAATSIHSKTTATRISVGNCPPVIASDLGNSTSLTTAGIVAASYKNTDGSDAPMIRIIRHQVLCEVAGRQRNTVGEISVLVEYQCMGLACPGFDRNSPNPVTIISQIQIQCRSTNTFFSAFGTIISSGGGNIRIDNIPTVFSTPTNLKCGACVDPATGTPGNRNNDPVTFCGGMYASTKYSFYASYILLSSLY